MLALQLLREDPDAVREGVRRKGETAPIDEILALDLRARGLRAEVEGSRAEQRRVSREIRGKPTEQQRLEMAGRKLRMQQEEAELAELDRRIGELLLEVPNLPHPSVPTGSDETANVTVRTWGEPPAFASPPLAHHELGERLGIFDFDRAAKLSGARFAVLRGQGARLQRALISLMLDIAVDEHGYTEVSPPHLVRRESMVATGNLPKFEDDAFHADGDLFLIPTAEVPLTNLYREEILEGSRLPIAHVAATPCFRREAGAAGRDTRGYIRLHQFEKVELVRFVEPETSLEELEVLTRHAESVLQRLGISYRVVLMCSGDMGFAQWKKYDIEAWAPGMQRHLEVSSCSVFSDFQARRANIRYRPGPGEKPRFLHTLNGSALGVPRTLDAVLENYQQPNGDVVVPEVLRPYMGGIDRLTPP